MGIVLRQAARFVREQFLYWLRSGSWWVPVVTVILAIAVVLAATAQVVVPHAVYVLF